MTGGRHAIRVDLGDLPVWHGVQETPALICAPFALAADDMGLIRLDSPETSARTVEGYGGDDYRFPTSPPGSSAWGDNLAHRSLDGLARLVGRLDGLRVLEIGGGTLYCARHMVAQMGAQEVTLIDPAAREEADGDRLRVRREYFSPEAAIESPRDLIVSFNTLEHVPDPIGFLRAAQAHLAEDGRLFLKVPDCGHSLAGGDLGMCTHEHLTYFTSRSLDTLLRATGFERVAEANYLGALQILARKAPADPKARCKETDMLLARFAELSTAHMDRLTGYGDRHRGRRAAFIGASVGLSNVLHLSRIADMLEIEIYDGDSLKTGHYLPGCDRPIQLTDDPGLEAHDVIFVTPVNFYDEIHSQLTQRSGLARARINPVFPVVEHA